MNTAPIYIARKLEPLLKELIAVPKLEVPSAPLGDWSATLFYVRRKKCCLLINNLTKYMLVLEDLKKADIKDFDSIFKDTLLAQLCFDDIKVDRAFVEKLIGQTCCFRTNNNQSAVGYLKNNMYYIESWSERYGAIAEYPFREMNHRLNKTPIKAISWNDARVVMKEKIEGLKV